MMRMIALSHLVALLFNAVVVVGQGTIGNLNLPVANPANSFLCPPNPFTFEEFFNDNTACLAEQFFTGSDVTCAYDPVLCRLGGAPPVFTTTCECIVPTGPDAPDPGGWTCNTAFVICDPTPVATDCHFDRGYFPETGDACDFSGLDDPDKVCRFNPIACREAQSEDDITFRAICTCNADTQTMECTQPDLDITCLRGSQFNALIGPQCPRANRNTGALPSTECSFELEYAVCKYSPTYCPNDATVDPFFAESCECRKNIFRCDDPIVPDCGGGNSDVGMAPPEPGETTTAPPSGDFCFPGSALVKVMLEERNINNNRKTTTTKQMKDLRIGDLVQVDEAKFEPIYSFGHLDAKREATFVEINKSLRLTPQHLIWKQGASHSGEFVAAADLKVGDAVLRVGNDNNKTPILIQSIRHNVVARDGVYAPMTPSGTIVVHNILTSCYANVLPTILGANAFHTMAHLFQFPHRVACHYLHSCPDETYTSPEGISTWMAGPLQFVQKLAGNNHPSSDGWSIRLGLMSISVVVLSIFGVLEYCLQNPSIVVMAVISSILLVVTLFRRNHHQMFAVKVKTV